MAKEGDVRYRLGRERVGFFKTRDVLILQILSKLKDHPSDHPSYISISSTPMLAGVDYEHGSVSNALEWRDAGFEDMNFKHEKGGKGGKDSRDVG